MGCRASKERQEGTSTTQQGGNRKTKMQLAPPPSPPLTATTTTTTNTGTTTSTSTPRITITRIKYEPGKIEHQILEHLNGYTSTLVSDGNDNNENNNNNGDDNNNVKIETIFHGPQPVMFPLPSPLPYLIVGRDPKIVNGVKGRPMNQAVARIISSVDEIQDYILSFEEENRNDDYKNVKEKEKERIIKNDNNDENSDNENNDNENEKPKSTVAGTILEKAKEILEIERMTMLLPIDASVGETNIGGAEKNHHHRQQQQEKGGQNGVSVQAQSVIQGASSKRRFKQVSPTYRNDLLKMDLCYFPSSSSTLVGPSSHDDDNNNEKELCNKNIPYCLFHQSIPFRNELLSTTETTRTTTTETVNQKTTMNPFCSQSNPLFGSSGNVHGKKYQQSLDEIIQQFDTFGGGGGGGGNNSHDGSSSSGITTTTAGEKNTTGGSTMIADGNTATTSSTANKPKGQQREEQLGQQHYHLLVLDGEHLRGDNRTKYLSKMGCNTTGQCDKEETTPDPTGSLQFPYHESTSMARIDPYGDIMITRQGIHHHPLYQKTKAWRIHPQEFDKEWKLHF